MTPDHDTHDDESRSDPYADRFVEEMHLLDYVKVLHKRRGTVVSVFLIVVIIGMAQTFTETPRYQARARVLLEASTPNVIAFREVIHDSVTAYGRESYETQLQLLKSRALARRTLESLGLWAHPVLTGAVPVRSFRARRVVVRAAATVASWMKTGWRAVFPARPDPTEYSWEYDAGEADTLSRAAGSTAEDADERSGVSEMRDESRVINAYLGSLSSTPVPDSRLVDIVFTSVDPRLAAALANGHAQAVVEQNIEFKFLASKDASNWLGERLAEQRTAVEAAEVGLHRYRQKRGAVSFEDREDITVQRLTELNAAATRAKTELIAKEAEYRQLEAASSDRAALDTLPVIASNGFIQQLKGELAALESQRAELAENLGARHPDMIKVETSILIARARLVSETNKIVQSVRNEFLAAQAQERSLARELDNQKVQALAMNEMGIEYSVLLREAESTRQVYDRLLQRARETEVSTELRNSSIRIMDEAEVPRGPVSPNTLRAILLAVLFGGGLGVSLAFFLEYLDNRIKTPEEVKSRLGLASLGLIPTVNAKALRTAGTGIPLMNNGVPPHFAEAFRKVRTGVIFSSADDKRSFVITSTGPGEGKSVVTTNLGISLAQAQQRVLLIDADMRRPSLHHAFGLDQEPGLSDLLCNQAQVTDVIRETPVPRLWVTPAGTLPPNPAELLGSNQFRKLLASLARLAHFDWVLLDSPPVMAVTDASLVANVARGVIFVVGAEMTSRHAAQQAVEGLEAAGARFAGAVLNRVDLDRNGYYYSRYYRPQYQQYYIQDQPSIESPSRAGSTPQV